MATLVEYLLTLTSFLIVVVKASADWSAEDCFNLGFHKANLLCSSCDHLRQFDLDVIKDHCKQCCHADEDKDAIKKYPKAVLEVSFVKGEKAKAYPGLTIRYVRGADPSIKLLDNSDQVQDVLAIDKWNTDSVEEFLNTHLGNDESNEI
uniref:Selenoprotein F n=1 Tax=Strigamia maritima TaxID=126957 RepID=T1IWL9_STRMM